MISLKNNFTTSSLKRFKIFFFFLRFKGSAKSGCSTLILALFKIPFIPKIHVLVLKTFTTDGDKVFDPRVRALGHFDDFYKAVFGPRWPSIRLALLSRQKYVAVLNNFTDIEKTQEFLEYQGAFNLGSFLENEKNDRKMYESNTNADDCENSQLARVVMKQEKKEKGKEMSELYSEKAELRSNISYSSDDGRQGERVEELLYDPKEARSSLHADLLSSQIDNSRIIEPQDNILQSSLNYFIPATVLRGLEDYVPESDYYKYYQVQSSTPITIEKEYNFDFPEKLKVYTFGRGDITELPDPFTGIHHVYNYLKVDGSDLLAALALGVQLNDKVLDLCSFSGDMAYCIFQTLRPKTLICSTSGTKDTENIFRYHLHDYTPSWREMLFITDRQLDSYESDQLFDKVLVKVPCTKDKSAVLDLENNMFHPHQLHQRLQLPELQFKLLLKALCMVRPGGTVLYVTSTMSPIQNEGVVGRALTSAWENHKMEFCVRDLTPALHHTSNLFNFGDFLNLKYGTLVVPFAPTNFGPKYFCKLVKKEAEK